MNINKNKMKVKIKFFKYNFINKEILFWGFLIKIEINFSLFLIFRKTVINLE